MSSETDVQRAARHVRETSERYRELPLGMPESERRRLMQTMLDLNKRAMETFDWLEADAVSEHDLLASAQLVSLVNEFTEALKAHAQRKMR